jgi:phosphoglycerol transferase
MGISRSWRDAILALAPYIAALLGCFVILTWWLNSLHVDLKVNFVDGGDLFFYQLMAKSTINNGWFLHNDSLGVPFGMDVYDFPQTESVHMIIIKLLSLITQNYIVVFNIYTLLTFPLTAIATLFVLRHLGFSRGAALVVSMLYAFVLFHFHRVFSGHPFLGAYYLVPFIALVALWVYLDQGLYFSQDANKGRVIFHVFRRKTLFALAIGCLVGSSGVYYSFFSCYLLLVAGTIAAFGRRRIYPLLNAAIVIGVIVFTMLVNLTPNFIYTYKHGTNVGVAKRYSSQAEEYGLKMVQMLLPVSNHRLQPLARVRSAYDQSAPLNNENQDSSLGIIGAVGLILLLARPFVKPVAGDRSLLDGVALLNLSAFLLATIGGFGSLFSYLVSPGIRAYTRMSVFIAFFSFVMVAAVIDCFFRRYRGIVASRLIRPSLLTACLAIGLFDQIPQRLMFIGQDTIHAAKEHFCSDSSFVNEIESSVRPEAMIFQLPFQAFLEQGAVEGMDDYDHLRGYFHSKRLRWSYGGVEGRKAATWQARVASLPPQEMVKVLSLAGFSGIYINRSGYADGGVGLESELGRLLELEPKVSADVRLSFFSLSKYNDHLAQQLSSEELQAERQAALEVGPYLVIGNGFSPPEKGAGGLSRYCEPKAALQVVNESQLPETVELTLSCATIDGQPGALRLQSSLFSVHQTVTPEGVSFSQRFTLPPGRHKVRVTCDGPSNAPLRFVDLRLGDTPDKSKAEKTYLVDGCFQGTLDLVNGNTIAGWAWDSSRPNNRVAVDIYDGDTLLKTVPAEGIRQDLVEAKIGDGRHGFFWSPPARLKDGKPHSVRAKVSGANVELDGSPMQFRFVVP